jgi:hypothetical protein
MDRRHCAEGGCPMCLSPDEYALDCPWPRGTLQRAGWLAARDGRRPPSQDGPVLQGYRSGLKDEDEIVVPA